MRKAKQEIRDEKILAEILSGAIICRVAMLDGDRPYIIPFNYGYSDGCLFIHSAPEGKKIDLLKQNPEVCFEVEIFSDEASKQQGLEVIMAQHGAPELVEFNSKNLGRMVILKLTISSMTGKQSSNWMP